MIWNTKLKVEIYWLLYFPCFSSFNISPPIKNVGNPRKWYCREQSCCKTIIAALSEKVQNRVSSWDGIGFMNEDTHGSCVQLKQTKQTSNSIMFQCGTILSFGAINKTEDEQGIGHRFHCKCNWILHTCIPIMHKCMLDFRYALRFKLLTYINHMRYMCRQICYLGIRYRPTVPSPYSLAGDSSAFARCTSSLKLAMGEKVTTALLSKDRTKPRKQNDWWLYRKWMNEH